MGGGGFIRTGAGLTQHDARRRLAAERIVLEESKAGKDHQEQAKHHGKRLQTGERQPEPALWAYRFLSKRRAQIVGRVCHKPPRITGAEDTTAGQKRGSSRRLVPHRAAGRRASNEKGGPKAARSQIL